ncbi:ATP-binding protein [Sulfolobus sp. B1]|uniref:P-loop NTPase n=1 Tax=Sulfolobaceae TaxID=118883 RepID=UPI000845DB2B|nr:MULTISPECIES: P-loop NTPase [unclassified Sulfolobus]TRM74342.1 ATP-binding protein [Sulfolobus sp. E5]TRM79538.1 ATP-binding protein [Sulfolobus sp. B5]TRM82284.1 ATP-binding protein [Sulfolobus sp. D5]TRM85169.1 ATP-binding protein [Sulfolobus sp. F3]TRN00719.1 ATP-binding protein [Sulfolobus sp. E1]TRN00743.1 ATP-binding protein [Sulfolobus sp. F1]
MEPLRQLAKEKLRGKRVFVVMSAKGGVGKSIISSLLALSLSESEKTTVIDVDVHTMAIAKLFGLEGRLHEVSKLGVEPFMINNSLGLVSLSGVVKDNYVILPGISQDKVIESIIAFGNLKEAKNVVFDLPPGLGDELLVIERVADRDYAPIVVTTPSKVSVKVVEYLIKYLVNERKVKPMLLVNMSYFNCGDKVVRPFGDVKIIKELSEKYGIKFFELPIDTEIEAFIGNIQNYNGVVRQRIRELVLSRAIF